MSTPVLIHLRCLEIHFLNSGRFTNMGPPPYALYTIDKHLVCAVYKLMSYFLPSEVIFLDLTTDGRATRVTANYIPLRSFYDRRVQIVTVHQNILEIRTLLYIIGYSVSTSSRSRSTRKRGQYLFRILLPCPA
ncbi:hypothetical protein GDO78_013601 [Eleutherodactylus coqui]|uniref:Uncharacterized protein n=1 Tax=Eleutherodactylus coqui TaxID=57060 RepID=A0A8J6B3V9_ELECQ|nr:hypothetical protein GDO78_013601 [Eleutherodactylus coqui]